MEFGKRHDTTEFCPRQLVTDLLRTCLLCCGLVTDLLRGNWCDGFCPLLFIWEVSSQPRCGHVCRWSFLSLLLVSLFSFLLLSTPHAHVSNLFTSWLFIVLSRVISLHPYFNVGTVQFTKRLNSLVLPVIFLRILLFSPRSCFYSKRLRHWMAFCVLMCRSETTHSLIHKKIAAG